MDTQFNRSIFTLLHSFDNNLSYGISFFFFQHHNTLIDYPPGLADFPQIMSLSAAASALAPNPQAEKMCELGHQFLSQKKYTQARDCFAKAVELTHGTDKVYAFALAQSELSCKNIPAAIKAFQLSHAAAPDWFAPQEALRMLKAPLKAAATESSGSSKK